jgi:hypothetical protein
MDDITVIVAHVVKGQSPPVEEIVNPRAVPTQELGNAPQSGGGIEQQQFPEGLAEGWA